MDGLQPPLISGVEAVEKVPKQILGQDAEKSDLIEFARIKDLMLGKGHVTPENHPLIVGAPKISLRCVSSFRATTLLTSLEARFSQEIPH